MPDALGRPSLWLSKEQVPTLSAKLGMPDT
jgi:hypothetical protein